MERISAGLTYRFEEFEVDVLGYELRRSGQRIRLARQPMDLLLLLLERPQELVSREEITTRLWGPQTYVDPDAGIHTAILRIRQALCDSRESPRFIETSSGKGYRFIAPVETTRERATSALLAAPANSIERYPCNLSEELTSFVGRQQELKQLPVILASSRLLSLTGPGGVGKTRLAARLARELVRQVRHGAWMVDLAALAEPDLLAQTIATVLGVREGQKRSARDVLLDTLRDRELLLVLDTCEHVVTACAVLVDALLRAAPGLRIIATSREALGVSGEAVFHVAPLSTPEPAGKITVEALGKSDATQLFLERACAVDPLFTATPDNADAVVRICQRLDGIPLAIELAAARVAVLSIEQIEARLRDRFRLLTGGARTAVARQRTLDATMGWSYQLLSNVERQFLSRLSVFPGTWSLDAAEHVCAGDDIDERDVLDLLSRLVSKSLVMVHSEFAGGRRYHLLETVRQYARERLVEEGTADQWRGQHFDYFFNEFRGALPVLRHHDQLRCLRRLRMEQENVRAALDWALSSSALAERGVELASALFWFWTKCGLYEEGRLRLEQALAVDAPMPRSLRARTLIGLTHMHHFQGHSFDAVIAEALALGRDDEDAWVVSFALFMQGLAALESGDPSAATLRALEAREAGRVCGEEVQEAGPLLILANIAVANGEHERAQGLYDEAVAIERRAGELWGLSISLSAVACLRIVRRDFHQARADAEEAMAICEALEDPRGIAWNLEVFAALLAAAGRADGAARLWGASDQLLDSVGAALSTEIRWIRDHYLDGAKLSLGEEAFEAARGVGRSLPLGNAVTYAREQTLGLC